MSQIRRKYFQETSDLKKKMLPKAHKELLKCDNKKANNLVE